MAYAVDRLDPSICAKLEEAESLLVEKADPHVLGQVMLEELIITQDDLSKMVYCILSSNITVFKFVTNMTVTKIAPDCELFFCK